MNPLRSVGARLALALLVLLAAALAIVYGIVVPSLERRLVDSKVSQLEEAAPGLARQLPLPRDPVAWADFLEGAAAASAARVVIFELVTPGPTLVVLDDSRRGSSSGDVGNDPFALRAALRLGGTSGTLERGGERYAEAAAAVPGERSLVLLLSAPLGESLASVDLVERRLLVAGAIALAVAAALGYAAAWLFVRRLRRLERAADRIAGGRFDEPVGDGGADELGQLATAFERMRERLGRLDHARREFIANASHELRTPLFSLSGFLELLADEELDEATRAEFVTTARQQVERLTKLATDLLDLSRLDAGRLDVAREPVDLRSVADALVEEFRPLAGGRMLEVVDGTPVPARGDEGRILQIGRILLENARVHTPAKSPVRIGTRAAGGRAQLWVEDEGPGIPAEHLPHVFDRFYRVDDGAMASGSGLGLAIARELAALMDGELSVESRPGRTAFTLALPLESAPFSRENGAAQPPERRQLQ